MDALTEKSFCSFQPLLLLFIGACHYFFDGLVEELFVRIVKFIAISV